MITLLTMGIVLIVYSLIKVIATGRSGGPRYAMASALVFGDLGLVFIAVAIIPPSAMQTLVVVAFSLATVVSLIVQRKLWREERRRRNMGVPQ